MIVKEAEYKSVQVTQRKCISEAVYGCDECGAEIKNYPNEDSRLEVDVFNNEKDTSVDHLHFCSWDCVLKHIPKIDSDYFVSLPYLYYDSRGNRSANRFIEIINQSSDILRV